MKGKILLAAGALALVVLVVVFATRRAGGDDLSVVSFGGTYQDAQRTAFFKPFETSTGIHIAEGSYNGDFGLLRERATAAAGVWDVVSVEAGPMLRAEKEGLWLKLPDSVFAGLTLDPKARRPSAAGQLTFATVLAYDPAKIKATAPLTWKDFFDVSAFPGKRGLRDNPRQTLEIALLADGVAPGQLYPLDVDRALRKLATIRNDVLFWDAGAQPIEWLGNGTVVMTAVWNGRIWKAKFGEKAKIDWSLKQGLWEMEFFAIPKNALHPEQAIRFVRSTLETDQQAAFGNTIAYSPVNRDAVAKLTTNVRSAMPGPDDDGAAIDDAWWSDNEAAVLAKWQQWKLQR